MSKRASLKKSQVSDTLCFYHFFIPSSQRKILGHKSTDTSRLMPPPTPEDSKQFSQSSPFMVKYMFILVKHILHENKKIAQVTFLQVRKLLPKAEPGSFSSSNFPCIQIFVASSIFFKFSNTQSSKLYKNSCVLGVWDTELSELWPGTAVLEHMP